MMRPSRKKIERSHVEGATKFPGEKMGEKMAAWPAGGVRVITI